MKQAKKINLGRTDGPEVSKKSPPFFLLIWATAQTPLFLKKEKKPAGPVPSGPVHRLPQTPKRSVSLKRAE